ncbi:MAG TPA: cation-translocating P-type ATPase [Burkholderiaceae bacterium]|nr:cation-translocating P-type ATPase [Burkholderiaceae bacterium]
MNPLAGSPVAESTPARTEPAAGAAAAAGPIETSYLQLGGLFCAACAGLIEQALLAEPGVVGAHVNYASRRARVDWQRSSSAATQLVRAVERAGYSAVPDQAEPARRLRQREERSSLWKLFVASFCMMQVMMYATPAYIAAPGALPPDLLRLLQWASWLLSIPVLAFSASPMFRDAFAGLARGRVRMDLPVVIGIAVTFIVSSGATFAPGGVFGREVYFDSLTMFITFLLLGRWLSLKAQHRVTSALEAACATRAPEARRIDADGTTTLVPTAELRIGDSVKVLAGEAFGADGVVTQGRTQVDESLLTGESRSTPKRAGDEVMSGSLNLAAPVTMTVRRLGRDTRFEAVVTLMREALTQRPALLRTADRIAVPFLWGVLLLAAVAAAAWSVIDPSRAVLVAVSVLIVTCPCALSLAGPSALLAAAGALARRGILVQRIDAFEALAKLDTLFLDKTGTLTEDRLQLLQVRMLPAGIASGLDEASILRLAGSLAANSSHPLSRALAREVEVPDAVWSRITEVPGRGLQAFAWDGTCARLGAQRWVDPAGTGMPDVETARVWFGDARGALASFEFGEFIKPDAKSAVRSLSSSGLRLVMLSGDEPERVFQVARTLRIDEFHGGKSPEAKLAQIEREQRAGHRVGMVGDGLNDAPVIARADVSFAFAQGAAITQSSADFILLSGKVADIAIARETAQRAMRVLRQNIAWAIGYNALCIPLALLGAFPPWAAGIGMASSSLFVVLNSLRVGMRSRIG